MKTPKTFALALLLLAMPFVIAAGIGQIEPRSPIIYVAASDSTAWAKMRAHFVCNGTDDQVEIEAAIAKLMAATSDTITETISTVNRTQALQGGKVFLAAGGYHITDEIDVTTVNNLTIEGEGNATTLFNDATDGSHCIDIDGTSQTYGLWHTRLRHFRVQGNEDSGDGIHMYKVPHSTIEDVTVTRNGGAGIYLEADSGAGITGADNHVISDCRATINYGYGIHLVYVHETLIASCHVEENLDNGIQCDNATDVHITGCSIEDQNEVGSGIGIEMVACVTPFICNTTVEDAITIGLSGSSAFVLDSTTTYHATITGGTNTYISVNGCGFINLSITGSVAHLLLNSCRASGYVDLTSTADSSYLSVIGCDLSQTAGTFTFDEGEFANSSLKFSTGTTIACDFDTSLTLNGCNIVQTKDVSVGPSLQITGCYIEFMNDDVDFIASAANNVWTITGNSFYGDEYMLFDGNGQGSSSRITFAGNTSRYAFFKFEDIDYCAVNSNTLRGSGGISFTNIDAMLTFNSNIVQSYTQVTVANTCAAQCVMCLNNISGDCPLSFSGTGSKTVQMNTLGSGTCTGWGADLGDGDLTLAGTVDAADYSVGAAPGVSGSWTAASGETITVTNGIITAITGP